MHGDYLKDLGLFLLAAAGTVLAIIFGLWLLLVLLFGKSEPSLFIWFSGVVSWLWLGAVGVRVAYVHFFGG